MAKIKLVFDENHIKLIKCLNFEKVNDSLYGIDNYSLWGGTFLYEQMAMILGINDMMIPESAEDPTGPKYPDEQMEMMADYDAFFVSNIDCIEEILHQFCTEGIEVGATYWCNDYDRIWHKD